MVLTADDARICSSAVDGRRRKARGVKSVAGGGRGDRERGVLWEIETEVVEGGCCSELIERGDETREAAEDQEVDRESVSAMLFGACSSGSTLGLIGMTEVIVPDGLRSVSVSVITSIVLPRGVMGVPCPLPAIAPVEFLSQTVAVGVAS